ncbi:MAG: TraB/GumN family protein [Crocinitomicaceae bacterium]|nr:TraB/GumN family protein [Flavobacteriales bacterium]NQZ35396.1 TraB/GumN family protein [Crocinitomicaceae bacterium]
MSKLFFLSNLLLFLFLGSTLFAQETTIRDYPMEDRALLWKIEGNGIKTKSYLFGTVHLIDKEQFFFPKKLQKIVSKSDVLTMEIAGLPEPMEALRLSMLEEGSFFDFFTEEQTDSIFVWVEEHTSISQTGFRMMVGKMRPFVVSIMLTELDETNPNRGMENKKSYEVELEVIAENKKLEIKGLETVAEQLGLFNALSDDQQVEMVMATIRSESNSGLEEIEKIMTLFADQDIDGLYQLIADDTGSMKGMNDILLDDRNKRWIPLIEQMITEKSTFIAVGAGHLGGPNGVIRLLEAKGYTLTPIEL